MRIVTRQADAAPLTRSDHVQPIVWADQAGYNARVRAMVRAAEARPLALFLAFARELWNQNPAMAYPLPPWSNAAFRFALVGSAVLLAVFILFLMIYVRSPLFTNQHNPIEQPILFDHRHHVADDQIDCRYCHQTAETSASAGFPSTAVCMNCHSQVWNRSPLLDPVRESFFSGRPLVWRRVYRLPDFVFFNHAIHVNKGVGCVTCHGRVDQMAGIAQSTSLTMGFCVDCHRSPEEHLRPTDQVTHMGWVPTQESPPKELGAKLATSYDVQARTACTTCHR